MRNGRCGVDDGTDGSDATEHRWHPGFTENGETDSLHGRVHLERRAQGDGESFGECPAGLRLERRYPVVQEVGGRFDTGLEAEVGVRTEAVGGLGVGASVGFVHQDDVHALGAGRSGNGPSHAAQATELADHHAAVDDLLDRADALGLAQRRHAGTLTRLPTQSLEVPQGVGPADAIARHAAAALELKERAGRTRPEDVIDPTGVEAQSAQLCL